MPYPSESTQRRESCPDFPSKAVSAGEPSLTVDTCGQAAPRASAHSPDGRGLDVVPQPDQDARYVVRGGRLERGTELGGYRIEQQIGSGGMGIVYRVTNVALGRVYALKVLAPELAEDEQFRRRFQREMQIAASIDHPNVVGIHYAGEQDGFLFLAMDYVHGEDLRELILRDGAVDPARAVGILTQVGFALDAAHAKGLVHRDIKPGNVLLTTRDGEERAYLTDFGLAKRSSTLAELTVAGSIVGTADYMAPEQVRGDPSDVRTDIYALGCVFFQMLTGKVPYERDTTLATMFAHVNDPPPVLEPPLVDEFPEFTPVVQQAMAKTPDDRYLSAGDLARDAAAALSGARYKGAPSMVATGDARPAPARAAAESSAEPAGAPASPAPSEEERQTTPTPPPDDTQGGSRLRRYRWAIAGLLALMAAALVAVVLLTSGGGTTGSGQTFQAVLRPVPTNHVTGPDRGGHAARRPGNGDGGYERSAERGVPPDSHSRVRAGHLPAGLGREAVQRSPSDQHHGRPEVLRTDGCRAHPER